MFLQVNKTVQRVMSSILCHSIFDIFTLLDMLHQLMNNLKSQVFYHTYDFYLLFVKHVDLLSWSFNKCFYADRLPGQDAYH